MNPRETHRPRLVCRLVRGWSSIVGTTLRHASTCEDCRRHFSAADDLEQELRHAAARRSHPVPAGLEERIYRSVRTELPIRPARRTPSVWMWGSLAAACAAALVAALLILQPAPRGHEHEIDTALVAKVIDEGLTNLSGQWRAAVNTSAAALERNPLQNEMNAVYADTRSALRFLALNFLPEVPADLAPSPTDASSG